MKRVLFLYIVFCISVSCHMREPFNDFNAISQMSFIHCGSYYIGDCREASIYFVEWDEIGYLIRMPITCDSIIRVSYRINPENPFDPCSPPMDLKEDLTSICRDYRQVLKYDPQRLNPVALMKSEHQDILLRMIWSPTKEHYYLLLSIQGTASLSEFDEMIARHFLSPINAGDVESKHISEYHRLNEYTYYRNVGVVE